MRRSFTALYTKPDREPDIIVERYLKDPVLVWVNSDNLMYRLHFWDGGQCSAMKITDKDVFYNHHQHENWSSWDSDGKNEKHLFINAYNEFNINLEKILLGESNEL